MMSFLRSSSGLMLKALQQPRGRNTMSNKWPKIRDISCQQHNQLSIEDKRRLFMKNSSPLLLFDVEMNNLSMASSSLKFDLFEHKSNCLINNNKDLNKDTIVSLCQTTQKSRLTESSRTMKKKFHAIVKHLQIQQNFKGSQEFAAEYQTTTNSEYYRHNNNNKKIFNSNSGILMAFSVMSIFGFNDRDKDDNDEELTPLDILIRKGAYCLMKQEYAKAEEILHDALILAQDDDNYEKEMLINNILATSYFENEDLVHAEKIFLELIKQMLNHNTDPTDPAILELSLKLASIYSRRKDSQHKAVKGYQYVIDTLQEKLKDLIAHLDTLKSDELSDEQKNELALLGWGYDWLAKHYIGENNMEEATKTLKKAVEISLVVLGRTHDQTLILMNDVGTTLAMSDFPEEGCDYIKRAVEGAKEAHSQELASFYANLGLIHLQLMKIDEAIYYCEQSKKLASSNSQHYNFKDVTTTSTHCLDEIEKLSKKIPIKTNKKI